MKNGPLTKKLSKYQKYIKHFSAHKKRSVDDVHTLRIKSRELSSLISPDSPFYTQLKKLIKASNTIRDMDVFLQTYLKSLPKRLSVQLDIKSIKRDVKKKRSKKAGKLHAHIRSLTIPENAVFSEAGESRPLDTEKALPLLEQAQLHTYRIFIKKRLYNEKNSIPRDEPKIRALTKIKDLLGSINDNYNGLKQLKPYRIEPRLYEKIQVFTDKENLRLYTELKEIQRDINEKHASSMRRLFLIRHAKSSWKDTSLSDFDRPLNKRGRSDAPLMGSKLKDEKISPDIIISSPALRAKTTAEIIAKSVHYGKAIIFDENIYESTPAGLHKILTKADDKNSLVFLVGHNPELSMLAKEYTGFDENIVTCGIVEIAFSCDRWADISAENARLISFDYPKKASLGS